MTDRAAEYAVGTIVALMFIVLFGALGLSAYDEFVLDRASFHAQVACEQRGMLWRRQFLTTTVACVPRHERGR